MLELVATVYIAGALGMFFGILVGRPLQVRRLKKIYAGSKEEIPTHLYPPALTAKYLAKIFLYSVFWLPTLILIAFGIFLQKIN